MPRDRARTAYKAAVAVELRTQGCSYDEIAKELGYASKSGAWAAVQRSLKQRAIKGADMYFAKSMVELDMLQERSWKRAMLGDTKSIHASIGVINSRAKLLGFGK